MSCLRVSCTFRAEVAIKPEENVMFEKAQIEVPVGRGIRGLPPPDPRILRIGINIISHAMRRRAAADDGKGVVLSLLRARQGSCMRVVR